MSKFMVECRETTRRAWIIEADSPEHARDIAHRMPDDEREYDMDHDYETEVFTLRAYAHKHGWDLDEYANADECAYSEAR